MGRTTKKLLQDSIIAMVRLILYMWLLVQISMAWLGLQAWNTSMHVFPGRSGQLRGHDAEHGDGQWGNRDGLLLPYVENVMHQFLPIESSIDYKLVSPLASILSDNEMQP